ncbi:MAG: hypothetical protein EPN85_03135 [Bacteroidetes bacterium]|nr:MAG: hypothetical protein EPN85_03135 [Bacteroidota bacterium]
MRKNFVFVCFFIFQSFFAIGQNIDFTKSNFTGKEDGLKEASANIKKGDEFYRAGTFMYHKALEFYLKANDFNSENASLNYKIGTCYLYSSFKQNALAHLEKAKKLNPEVNNKLYYYLGRAFHLRMQWTTAIEQFELYKKRIAQTSEEKIPNVEKKIQECKYGIELMKDTLRFSKLPDSLRYKIENMGASVNSQYPDYRPVISADEAILVFTARRMNTTGGGMDPYDGKYFEDIYISNNEKGTWSESKNLGDPINTSNRHDATCGISVDGQKLYIYLDDTYDGSGNIYECKLDGRNWSEPQKMPKAINSRYHESSASLSPDGKTIYFCSENLFEYPGQGTHDIFKVSQVIKDGKTEWSEPENLGTTINTQYDERTVFIHPDGKTLYFSSEGHNSMGGYDMFKSVYNDSTKKWSKPLNLGYPVNTPDDDVDFVVSASGKHAYYASVRPDGFGEKDIYRITLPADTTVYLTLVKGNVADESKNPVKAKIEIIDSKTGKVISVQESNSATGKFLVSLPSGKNYKMNVTADGYYPQQKDFNIPKGEKYKELEVNIIMKRKVQMVSIDGEVTDEKNVPLQATVEIINNATGEVIVKTTTDKLGKYLSKLQAGKNYGMVVSADGYLFESLNLDIPPDKERMKIPPIRLKKIEAGKNIVLNNIFFDFDRATLRADSKPELDRVAKVLKENPSMKIEISGHTDSKGSATYNLRLSEARAKSVVDYLISSGIEKSNLAYKGYGFLKPIASNDTEEGRQQNRRTEFKVMEIDPNAKVTFTSPKEEGGGITVKKLPEHVLKADKNNDGKISADEIIFLIDNFLDGESDFTFEKINAVIEYFFEQD